MEYRIEVLASFKKEAKRLRKHYASFIDDYENKAERESIRYIISIKHHSCF